MTAPVLPGLSPTSGGPAPCLTDREHAVLSALANGDPYQAIARRIGLTQSSTVNIGSRIMRKLGARSLPHAVLLACQHGLLDGKPRRHGDHAGFAAHRYRGEEPCEACWDGERAYRADRRTARKAAKSNAA